MTKTKVSSTQETNKMDQSEEKVVKRLKSIDRFRGIAIFCMIFFQMLANFSSLPFLSSIAQHNPSRGIVMLPNLTIADLIPAIFFFAIGLSYKLSYDKRVALYGREKTEMHFVLRFLLLMGVAGLLSMINVILGGNALRIIDFIYLALGLIGLIGFLAYVVFGWFNKKSGARKIFSTISRYVFIVFGVILIVAHLRDFAVVSANAAAERFSYWTVLQAIAMAGLIAIPFMKLNLKNRVISVVLMLLAIIVYHEAGNQALIDAFTQGGAVGSFAWAIIILTGTIFSELYLTRRRDYYITTFALLAPTVIFYLLFPINFGSASPSYILIGIQFSALLFFICNLFNFYKCAFDPLAWWGRYPILLYLLEFFVVGGFMALILPEAWFAADASPAIPLIFASLIVVAFTLLVYWLNKKNKRIVI